MVWRAASAPSPSPSRCRTAACRTHAWRPSRTQLHTRTAHTQEQNEETDGGRSREGHAAVRTSQRKPPKKIAKPAGKGPALAWHLPEPAWLPLFLRGPVPSLQVLRVVPLGQASANKVTCADPVRRAVRSASSARASTSPLSPLPGPAPPYPPLPLLPPLPPVSPVPPVPPGPLPTPALELAPSVPSVPSSLAPPLPRRRCWKAASAASAAAAPPKAACAYSHAPKFCSER